MKATTGSKFALSPNAKLKKYASSVKIFVVINIIQALLTDETFAFAKDLIKITLIKPHIMTAEDITRPTEHIRTAILNPNCTATSIMKLKGEIGAQIQVKYEEDVISIDDESKLNKV
uniref:Uncharacterized protein n=1 Tax=Glossina pallidipes TaxID=7398 RepID=A0A1A9ZTS9_GLOPL